MIYINYWTEEKSSINHISVNWSNLNCGYLGNIWNDKHEAIGNYCADTFQDIKNEFNFLFEK